MRQLLILILALSFFAAPLAAQEDASLFEITDVAVDIKSDTAVKARDQAIAQAQRDALDMLLERLGAEPTIAADLTNDDIATLVRNFEVQNERRSSVRYIGTFTVQFRPSAVRSFLSGHNASYTEERSLPVVVFPIFNSDKRSILWEETTKWRTAWENGSHSTGLVPVIVPTGDLDDIADLSTAEALKGDPESIRAIIEKYQANGAVVVILTADPELTGKDLKIDIQSYDVGGHAGQTTKISLDAVTNKNDVDSKLAKAVRQVRASLEKNWKQRTANTAGETISSSLPPDNQTSNSRLPVTVPIGTLAEWAQIRNRIMNASDVLRTDVITLQRGMTRIEIEFQGSIENLQETLLRQGLSLMQDSVNGTWILQQS